MDDLPLNLVNTYALDTHTFDLGGTHYQIGYQIGRSSPLFTLPSWWPEPPPLAFAHACAQQIAACHASLIDELYGHADAQQQSFDHLLRIVCRARLGGHPVSVPEQGGCTSFAYRAPNGHLMVGRNYDFYPIQRIRQRIRVQPVGAQGSVGMRGSVPGGRYDGVNHAGLFVSLHIVLAEREEIVQPGIPFHLIPRLILERCQSVRQALDLLAEIPHLHSFNYLLADSEEYLCVECHSQRIRIMRPERNGDVLAVGNFYQHPDMETLQKHRRQTLSRGRVAYLRSREWEHGVEDTPTQAVYRALSDHDHQVCGHVGGHTTLWSCIADMTAQRVWYGMGNPCQAELQAVVWP
jgi:predicted choloylglycine hydrolase